jgi:hypothetical protein
MRRVDDDAMSEIGVDRLEADPLEAAGAWLELMHLSHVRTRHETSSWIHAAADRYHGLRGSMRCWLEQVPGVAPLHDPCRRINLRKHRRED